MATERILPGAALADAVDGTVIVAEPRRLATRAAASGWQPWSVLKARLRPMRGAKIMPSLRTVATGPAVMRNLRRGHHESTVDVPDHDRVRVAFAELTHCL